MTPLCFWIGSLSLGAIVPKDPPIVQYVAAVEQACTRLEEGKAGEFRVQVKAAIQKIKKPKPNLTKGERNAIGELKKDQPRVILTADKGVALVVLNTEDYLLGYYLCLNTS